MMVEKDDSAAIGWLRSVRIVRHSTLLRTCQLTLNGLLYVPVRTTYGSVSSAGKAVLQTLEYSQSIMVGFHLSDDSELLMQH